MTDLLELALAEPPIWQAFMLAVIVAVFAVLIGAALAFVDLLVDSVFGPIRVLARWRDRRLHQDPSADRARLNLVVSISDRCKGDLQ